MKYRNLLFILVIILLSGCNKEVIEVVEKEPIAGDILLKASSNFDSMDNVNIDSTMSSSYLKNGYKHIEKKTLLGDFIPKDGVLHANEFRSFNQINGDLVNIDTEIYLLSDKFYQNRVENGGVDLWEEVVLDDEKRDYYISGNMPRSYLRYLLPYKDHFEISDKSTSESYVLLLEVPYDDEFKDLILHELESSYRLSEFKIDFDKAINKETLFRTMNYEITINKSSNVIENFKLVVDVTLKDGKDDIDIVKRINIIYSEFTGSIDLPSKIIKDIENQEVNLIEEDEIIEEEKNEINNDEKSELSIEEDVE